jgi:hypothetical protein
VTDVAPDGPVVDARTPDARLLDAARDGPLDAASDGLPDCRVVGCPEGLACGADTGQCSLDLDQPVFGSGDECAVEGDCPGVPRCGQYRFIHGEDFKDPGRWAFRSIEFIQRSEPDAVGQCIASCEDCLALPGAESCSPGTCVSGSCDNHDPLADDGPPVLTCAPNVDYC